MVQNSTDGKIKLGDKVRHKLALACEGIVIGRAEYLFGATQIQVLPLYLDPEMATENGYREPIWLDEAALILVTTQS